ncbi:hypothetical protein HispidOSU_024792, partial [Sigmodon hispidus]
NTADYLAGEVTSVILCAHIFQLSPEVQETQRGIADAAWRRHSPSTDITASLYLHCIQK